MARHPASASFRMLGLWALHVFLLAPAVAVAVDLESRYAAPFSTMPMYSTNFGVIVHDWNGDGLPDVTVACNTDDRVSTLKGAGHGAFGGRVDFVGPDGPYSVAAGDMDGDGTADMVIAEYDANSVRIYRMLPGDVSYSTILDLPTGLGPIDLVVADIDQDGDNDIVTSNFYSNNISVLRNSGGGTFLPHADYATGTEPWGLTVGKINGDAYPDIVTANYGSNNVTLWLGSSSGTLAFGSTIAVGANPTDPALLDYDEDGDLDVAVCNFGSASVTLLDGNGAGSLGVHGSIPSLSGYDIEVADFNNDGRPDLAIAGSELASGFAAVHLGIGPGGLFAPFRASPTGGELSEGISAGDLDGDGNVDLALTAFPRNVSILRGNGDGTFGVDRRAAASSQTYMKAALAEMTGDAHPDLVLAGSPAVRVAQGNGAGDFSLVGQSGTSAVDVAVADLDGDGDRDVASVNGTAFINVSLSFNAGDGTLSTGSIFTVSGIAVAVAAEDFNHDGFPDLAIASSTGEISTLLNLQGGSFSSPTLLPTSGGSRRAIAIVDLNADSDPDIVAANYTSDLLEVYLGDGSGGFSFDAAYATGDRPVSIAPFNADGTADLAVACEGNALSVFLNSGSGTFPPATSYASPGVPGAVIVGSADQDAYPDLFVLDRNDLSVSILNGSPGGGFFSQARAWGVSGTPEGLAVGDVNGDGHADIMTSGNLASVGSVQVLLYDTSLLPDRAPTVVAPISVNVEVGGSLSLAVTAKDPDLDAISSLTAGGLPPTATFTPNGTNTSGTVNYTPAFSQVGDYTATFTASNALSGSRATQIHVLASAGMAGTFTWTPKPGDPGTYQVCFIATNPNGDPPDTTCTTVTVLPPGGAAPYPATAAAVPAGTTRGPIVSAPSSATVSVGETLVLTPTATDANTLTVDASELPAGNDASFTADASPVVTAPSNVTAAPGVPLTIQVSAVDPDLTPLATLSASYPGLPPGNDATFVTNVDHSFGTFSWTPAANDSGTYAVTFAAANVLVGTQGMLIHVNSGLASYWMLNGNGNDAASGANMANPYSQPETYVPGRLHEALQTATPGSHLAATATALHDFPLGQPRTLECWVKVGADDGYLYEFVSAVNFAGQWWRLYHLNQIVTFEIMQNGISSAVSTVLPAGGAWHHFAAASDGSSMTLYMDGAPQGSTAISSQAIVQGGAVYIGLANGANFSILVDEVRLWHRRRTQAEILSMMNQEVGGHVTSATPSPPVYRNQLAQNQPNPFNPRTEISFELARGGPSTLRVYDASGRLVRTLVDQPLGAGPHRVGWDGLDASGRKAASGVYFYRLETPGFASARRLLLIK